jgi:hypothetical protein
MSVKVGSPHYDRCSARTCEERDGRRLPWRAFNAARQPDSVGLRYKHAPPATISRAPRDGRCPVSSPMPSFDPPARA